MEEELKQLGIELARLAKKYGTSFLTISYVNGAVNGFESPRKLEHVDIYLNKKEVEECLKEQNW